MHWTSACGKLVGCWLGLQHGPSDNDLFMMTAISRAAVSDLHWFSVGNPASFIPRLEAGVGCMNVYMSSEEIGYPLKRKSSKFLVTGPLRRPEFIYRFVQDLDEKVGWVCNAVTPCKGCPVLD
jgi:hypothetical protein